MLLVWLTGIASLLLFGGIAWYLAPLKPGILALQFAFTPRVFGEVIHFWSPEQLLRFRAHFVADYALLLSYGAFGWLLASRTALFDALPRPARIAATWALPLAALFDATENGLQLWLTEAPRFGVHWPYGLAASCACAKWVLLLAFAFTVLAAAAKTKSPTP